MTRASYLDEIDSIPKLFAYPGGDLVQRGLEDLAASRATPEAALVEVARTRLAELGLPVASRSLEGRDAELVLYERLGARDPDADVYGTYCAWLDQLVSFLSSFSEREGTRRRARPRL